MKATELRIGNYVIYECTTHIVCEISDKGISSWWVKKNKPVIEKIKEDIGGKEVPYPYFDGEKEYDSIPLTEEWLLKFGFKKENVKTVSKYHGSYFSMLFCDYKYSFAYADFRYDWGFYHSYTDACDKKDNNKFDFISCGIKYVHQLQNLYFALTGEELIFKAIES